MFIYISLCVFFGNPPLMANSHGGRGGLYMGSKNRGVGGVVISNIFSHGAFLSPRMKTHTHIFLIRENFLEWVSQIPELKR